MNGLFSLLTIVDDPPCNQERCASKIMQVFMSVLNANDDEIKSWGSTVRMDRMRVYNAINDWDSVSYPLPFPIPDCNLSMFAKYFDTLPADTKSLKMFFGTFKDINFEIELVSVFFGRIRRIKQPLGNGAWSL
jgi:hypothetical protein